MPEAPRALTVADVINIRTQVDPDAVAFTVDGADPMTYAEWERRSRSVAHSLLAAGAGRGQRVALLFEHMEWTEYAIGYLAVLRTGATALHLNVGMSDDEVTRRLKQCDVSRVVHSDRLHPPTGFNGPAHTFSGLDRGDTAPLEVSIDPDDIADVLYTSGTTGPAKPYTVPHANLTFGRKPEVIRPADVAPQHMLVPMLLGSSTSATCLHFALTATVISVFCAPDDVERIAELIAEFAVTTIALTPWIAIQMLEQRIGDRHDLSSVQMVASGSAPLPPPIAQAMLKLMPRARVTGACSQSEAGPAVLLYAFDPERPLSVGRPSPVTELRVVDGDGVPVPDGAVGEVWLRHPAPKRLYLELERNAGILADGWYHTGDYGRIGPDGDLYFFDRGIDLVRSEDRLISTIEVEAVLYEHPAVRQAAVFGVVTAGGETELTAAVVLTGEDQLPGVRELLASRLAGYQLPARFLVLEELPRSQNGKVLKQSLRELAAAS